MDTNTSSRCRDSGTEAIEKVHKQLLHSSPCQKCSIPIPELEQPMGLAHPFSAGIYISACDGFFALTGVNSQLIPTQKIGVLA